MYLLQHDGKGGVQVFSIAIGIESSVLGACGDEKPRNFGCVLSIGNTESTDFTIVAKQLRDMATAVEVLTAHATES